MLGVNSDSNHSSHLTITMEAGAGKSILPVAAIYGANAAGKSNLIKAIGFAKNLIVVGTRTGQVIPVSTFKLADYSKKPSRFQFIFIHKNVRYSYGFTLTSGQILEEWLYAIPENKKREVLYFERNTSDKKETKVEYGATLKGKRGKNKQFLDFIAQGTRPNQLFLTEAVERNVKELIPIVNWFKRVLTILSAESHASGLEMEILNSREFTEFLGNFLKFAGTGIDSIGVDEVNLNIDSLFPTIPDVLREKIIEMLAEVDINSTMMIETNIWGQSYILTKGEQGQTSLMQLKTKRRHEQGQLIDFSIEEESDGTQGLINLIPALFMLKESSEKVILLDELDRRLHPLLSRQFLNFFLKCKTEKSRSQLIFTTHDTNLLDLNLLRRDEIWFVEKDRQGASQLYSLAEFKIRPDLPIEKGYLNGRFGAIPFFGDIHSLGWTDCQEEYPIDNVNV